MLLLRFIGFGLLLAALAGCGTHSSPTPDAKGVALASAMAQASEQAGPVYLNHSLVHVRLKFVDQDGQSIEGVHVTVREFRYIALPLRPHDADVTPVELLTDRTGIIDRKCSCAAADVLNISKTGYTFSQHSMGFQLHLTAADDQPHLIHAWRQGGGDLLIVGTSCALAKGVPNCVTTVDLINGSIYEGDRIWGDLRITMLPGNSKHSVPPHAGDSAWTLHLQAKHGGVQSTSDAFPFRPPADGYAASCDVDCQFEPAPNPQTAGAEYFSHRIFNAYLKIRDGRAYASVTIWVDPVHEEIRITHYVNPTGARSLDPTGSNRLTEHQKKLWEQYVSPLYKPIVASTPASD